MSDTVQKYRAYVMTGFVKSLAPIVIDRASGAKVWDENGREYLDCFSGISVVNAGHCNPQVIAAAKAQMDKLVHCSSYLYHVQPVADLAEKLAHIAPRSNLTKTFFRNSGAQAIERARTLARLYTGTHEFIAIQCDGVQPDSRGTEKGLAGGLPLSAYTPRTEIAAGSKPGDHLSTFGGNPVSCAAALANIEFMEKENLPSRATESGNYAMAKLREVQKKHSLICEVRRLGLMIGVELRKDAQKTPSTAEPEPIR